MPNATNYDEIAGQYDRRYVQERFDGVRACIARWTEDLPTNSVLELGCGTGHWLAHLSKLGCQVSGIDASAEMLARVSSKGDLRHGSADALPWATHSFGGVLCVNALHHFQHPQRAIEEAHRVLAAGGRFLSIGLDPHAYPGDWYVYEYFPTTLASDLGRFPDWPTRTTLDEQAYREGIDRIEAAADLHGHGEPFLHVDLQLHATYAQRRT